MFLVLCLNANCQTKSKKVKKPVEVVKPDTLKKNNIPVIELYKGLFKLNRKSELNYITESVKNPIRGEFETLEEYTKRLPKPYDSTLLYYFKTDYYTYKYDIDKQILSIKGADKFYSWESAKHKAPNSFPLIFGSETEDKGSYEAKNGFGATVTVKKSYFTYYVLYFDQFLNWKNIYYNSQDEKMQIDLLNIEPKLAQRLSHDLEFILCVLIPNPSMGGMECIMQKEPKFDDPTEKSSFLIYSHAVLKKIILWDKTKNELVSETLIK